MTSRRSILLSLMLGAFLSVMGLQTANAQVPRSISYQGRLIKAGQPVNGTVNLTIKIYDASGAEKYTETSSLVEVKDGIFNVLLGGTSGTLPATLDFNEQYFLGINVDGTGEMNPRTPFVAAPYALNAELVGGVGVAKVPTPGMLLPLDANGKLPISVLPQAPSSYVINGIPLDDSLALNIINLDGSITVTNNVGARTIELKANNTSGITAVQSGPGLQGGGSTGIVILEIKPNGITPGMIGTGAVTGRTLDQMIGGDGLYHDILGNLNVGVNSTLIVTPDLIGLNLANPNTWTALQTFNAGITVGGTATFSGNVIINGVAEPNVLTGPAVPPVTNYEFQLNGDIRATGFSYFVGNHRVDGLVDLQNTISNTGALNGGVVFVGDAFTATGTTVLASTAGSTTTIGNTTGTLTTSSSTTNLNAITSITLAAPNINHSGIFTQTGNSIFTGTVTQTGGNVQLNGGTNNIFGSVAGSNNIYGATSSVNTFFGTSNTFSLTAPGFVSILGTQEPNAVNAASVTNYELRLTGDAQFLGATNLVGNTFLNQTLTVGGATTLNGATTINNTLNVNGASTFNGNITQTSGTTSLLNTTITGTLTQSGGNATINGGAANVFGSVAGSTNTIGATGSNNTITGATNAISSTGSAAILTGGNLTVNTTGNNNITGANNNITGPTNITGNTAVTGNFSTTGNNTLGTAGASTNLIQGASNTITSSGSTTINGTNVNVNGLTAINGNTQINGTLGSTGNLNLGSASTINNYGSASSSNRFNGTSNFGTIAASNGNKVIVDGVPNNNPISVVPGPGFGLPSGFIDPADYELIVNGDAKITGYTNLNNAFVNNLVIGVSLFFPPGATLCAQNIQVQNLGAWCSTPGASINVQTALNQSSLGLSSNNTFLTSIFNGNVTVNGNETVTGTSTTGNIINNGTLDQRGNIFSSVGSVVVNDAFEVTPGFTATFGGPAIFNGTITQLAGQLSTLGNLNVQGTTNLTGATTSNGITNTGNIGTTTLGTTGLATLNSLLVNTTSIFNGLATFNAGINSNGTINQIGAVNITGALTQSGGNATITGGANNTFGTVAGSVNTIGSVTSVNAINGNTTNTGNFTVTGVLDAQNSIINSTASTGGDLNINDGMRVTGNSQLNGNTNNMGVQTGVVVTNNIGGTSPKGLGGPVAYPGVIDLAAQEISSSRNNMHGYQTLQGDAADNDEHILLVNGIPTTTAVGDYANIDALGTDVPGVIDYEVIIDGDLLVTGHIASRSIPWVRSARGILRYDGLGGDVVDGYSSQVIAVAGVLATDNVSVTYITDKPASSRGILDAVAGAGTVTIRSTSPTDDNDIQILIHRATP